MTPRIITVDGAAGSGKTTLGRRLSEELQLPFLDTGLFYRAVMVAAVRQGIREVDEQSMTELARSTTIEINTDGGDRSWKVRVDGIDAAETLRDPANAILLAEISQVAGVRRALLDPQRHAGAHGCVAAGRDCGTVIFTEAKPKFFLQAPAEVRTARRSAQLARAGGDATKSSVEKDVVERDAIDRHSLGIADDAHIIDTSQMDAEATFAHALAICQQENRP